MVDTPTQARSKYATAHIGGPPDPEEWHRLRANLALSNIDAAIRKNTYGSRKFSESDLGHLIGLLIMQTIGLDGATVTDVESYVRRAVREGLARRAEVEAARAELAAKDAEASQ